MTGSGPRCVVAGFVGMGSVAHATEGNLGMQQRQGVRDVAAGNEGRWWVRWSLSNHCRRCRSVPLRRGRGMRWRLLSGSRCSQQCLFITCHFKKKKDCDFAGDLENSKSTLGGILCIFSSHTFVPTSWICKKQTSVSHSSTEIEATRGDRNPRSRLFGSHAR